MASNFLHFRSRPRPRRRLLLRTLFLVLLVLVGPGCCGRALAVTVEPTPEERAVGQRVILAALSRAGTPYAWGGGNGHGPTVGFCDGTNGYLDGVCQADHTVGFDCSGLALYSWFQATDGQVLLPHHSPDQLVVARRVPVDQIIPGDLLFFAHPGGPVHHVGIYVGGGAMLHAEHTGTVVTVLSDVVADPVWGPQLVAAARPVLADQDQTPDGWAAIPEPRNAAPNAEAARPSSGS